MATIAHGACTCSSIYHSVGRASSRDTRPSQSEATESRPTSKPESPSYAVYSPVDDPASRAVAPAPPAVRASIRMQLRKSLEADKKVIISRLLIVLTGRRPARHTMRLNQLLIHHDHMRAQCRNLPCKWGGGERGTRRWS